MNYTTNYNLNKPEGTDLYNHLTVDNPNMDTIDAAMHANKLQAIGSATELVSGTVHAITRADADQNIFMFEATGNFNTGDTITVDGTTVNAYNSAGQQLPDNAYIISSVVICVLNNTSLWVYCNKMPDAAEVDYDNTVSGLVSTDVQNAIDELTDEVNYKIAYTIPANTYATWTLALGAIKTAYDALPTGDKYRAKIRRADNIWYNVHTVLGQFVGSYMTGSPLFLSVQELDLNNLTFYDTQIKTSGNAILNNSTGAQTQKLELIVI